jgi:hypothetical protein
MASVDAMGFEAFARTWPEAEFRLAKRLDFVGYQRKLGTKELQARSKITNGSALLPSVDARGTWGRRFRDLNDSFSSDLGQTDSDALSEGQRALVRRASALCVELERLEVKFARRGGAEVDELNVFQRSVNSLRRVIESLGTHRGRIPRDVTPPTVDSYLAHTQQAAE